MRKLLVFAYNYEQNFISEIWKDEPMMVEHLKQKFKTYEDRSSSSVQTIINFLVQLDEENLRKVEEHIDKNLNYR